MKRITNVSRVMRLQPYATHESFVNRMPSSGRMDAIRVARLNSLDGLRPLVIEAERQGFDFMRRLVEEWASGANKFEGRGECLLGAFGDGRLLGVAGLNQDPYAKVDAVGRLRHLYVLASARRLGVGSLLVQRILQEARPRFHILRLRATTGAADFYSRLGFTSIHEKTASHVMILRGDEESRIGDGPGRVRGVPNANRQIEIESGARNATLWDERGSS
ncbi:MAG: GNAT family N-acetyltransferase [Hyphomicrobiales bacterium]|nr:GNAT family N-acetyltransferase [Hyphomicrobiales bacterium]